MSRSKSKQELKSEEDEIFLKNTKHKSNQYDKCKNYDCEENDNGFCMRYKNKAKYTCKSFE